MTTRRLKVLMTAYSVDAEDISEAQLAYEWIRHLADHVSLTVLSIGSRHARPSGLETLPNVRYIQVPQKIPWKRFDVLDRAVHPGISEFNWGVRRILRRQLRSEGFDVCHALAPFAPRYPSPLRKMSIPLIIGPLMGAVDIPEAFNEVKAREPFYFRLRKLDRLRIRWDPALAATYSNADRILLMGDYLREMFPERLRSKTEILSSIGVDTGHFHPGSLRPQERGPLRLLYVGRIVAFKGLQYVLQALSTLPPDLPVHLTIVGDGPMREECRTLSQSLGIEDRLTWAGAVAHHLIPSYFSESDVFCFPSLNEAGGIVVLEALASGKPVICVDRGGPGEVVDSTCGICVPAQSPGQLVGDLAAAIRTLVEDSDACRRLSAGALARVARYDWGALALQMKAVYERGLNSAGGGS